MKINVDNMGVEDVGLRFYLRKYKIIVDVKLIYYINICKFLLY